MHIYKRHREDVCVLDFVGSILLQDGGDALQEAVLASLREGWKKLVLNLGGVTHMDSSGLGHVVRCHALAQAEGGLLKIANITKGVRNLLAITKLVTVFDSYDGEDDAVRSFALSPA
ncbi:MAG TPA: STAS domain-containing protein [Vicinamibacteria bacterium]|nr:STAS domain-containing protein [Vicinamibacteria bacterium]